MSIDFICIAVFVFGLWQGYSRGIISTIFNLLFWLFGLTLAFKMAPVTRNLLSSVLDSDTDLMVIIAFAVNMVFILIALKGIARVFENVLSFAFLGIVNRALGGVVTGLFYVLIFSILLYFVNMANALNEATLAESKFFPYLKNMPPKAWAFAKRFQPMAKEMFYDSNNWIDGLRKEGVQRTESKQRTYRPPEDGRGIETDPVEEPLYRPADRSSGIEDEE